tara:strand:- start:1765 stop:2244 length:480 start_codon:yes stop_codon:yes gene_type:complete
MRKLKQGEIKAYRDEMLIEQDGKCAFCGQDCKKPCLDHAHMEPYKDKVRGVLCNWCNIAIGKLENARVRTGTSWEDFKKSFRRVHSYTWNIQTIYDMEGYDYSDWHPSKRKREVTEFRKMNADEQWDVIMAFPASMRGVSRPKNATERIKLFSKLNKKT